MHITTLLLGIIFIAGSVASIHLSEDFNKTVEFIIKEVDRDHIATVLKNLSSRPHVGGTPAEWENAQYVANLWESQGLDEVHLVPYKVLLSYPLMDKPNYVRIHNSADTEIWKSQGRTKPLHSEEEWSKEVFPDFNAYSATGKIKGNIVLINFAREEDFKSLDELGVNISGCIVIAKYGAASRANIVKAAEDRGAIGVLLYSDPQQYAQEGPDRVYPNTVYLPGTGAPFGSTKLTSGDPLTPYYPAIDSAFHIPEDEAPIPKIPVMPLSYDDATVILSKMGGRIAPAEWQGKLNLTYKIGPALEEGAYVSMEVNTHNQMSTLYNVVGVMKGEEEPGASYQQFFNHLMGNLSVRKLTRVLTDYKKQTGWRPRRTLMFISWGSEEYGLVGSQEWTEQFGKQLADRAVAYLNNDMSVEGNYTLRTNAAPMLYAMAREIAKLIPNPDPEEVKAGRTTTYDTWALRKPNEKQPGCPRFSGVGAETDYKGFQHNIGVPSLDYRYTYTEEMNAEPMYHTLYETFYLMSKLYDRGFHFNAAVTQLWASLAVYIADVKVIPFSLDEYAAFINDAQVSLFAEYGTLIKQKNINIDYFRDASFLFTNTTKHFQTIINNLNMTNDLAVRRINDQLMLVERAFIDPLGLPGRPDFNHVVFAPSSTNAYSTTAFSGLSDALHGIEDLPEKEQDRQWRIFEEHLATCTHLLLTASKVLSDDLW